MNRNFVGGLLQQTWILERVLLKPDIVCQETSTVCLFFFARLAVEKDIYEMKNRLVLYKGTRGDSCSVGDVSQPQKTRVTGEEKKVQVSGWINKRASRKKRHVAGANTIFSRFTFIVSRDGQKERGLR